MQKHLARVALLVAGGACVSSAGGCWLVSPLSGLGDVADASLSEVGDAGTDAPPNFVTNGDFETVGNPSECVGWVNVGCTASPSPVAHSGHWSCKICPNAPSAQFELVNEQQAGPGTNGTHYRIDAYFRLAPSEDAGPEAGVDAGPNAPRGQPQLQANYAADASYYGESPIAFGASWTHSPDDVYLSQGPALSINAIAFFFTHPGAPETGGCVLVDDVSITPE